MVNSPTRTTLNPYIKSSIFKILFIVRKNKLIDLLKLELSHEGYDVEVSTNGMSGLIKCRELRPHLIILDWHISIFSAADLCACLRTGDRPISIFVLDIDSRNRDLHLSMNSSSSKNTSHRVAALDAGADDCLSVPFAIDEFLARIRVQLRKYQVQHSSVFIFEDLRLNALTREVYRGDRYIYLTTKEFTLLEYLIAHPRQVLTRSQIIERVWGYDYLGDSNVIEVYIRYLRLKLEENKAKRLIFTVRSVGYVLRESSFN